MPLFLKMPSPRFDVLYPIDMKCLAPCQWLNDNIVNAVLWYSPFFTPSKKSSLIWLGIFTFPIIVRRLHKCFLLTGRPFYHLSCVYSNRSNRSRQSGMKRKPQSPTLCLIPVNYPAYNFPLQFRQHITLAIFIGFLSQQWWSKGTNISFLPPYWNSNLRPRFMILNSMISGKYSVDQLFQPVEQEYGPCERRVLNVRPLSSAQSNSRFRNKVTLTTVESSYSILET